MCDGDRGPVIGGGHFIGVFRGLRRIAHVFYRPVIWRYILLGRLYQSHDMGCNGAGGWHLSATLVECQHTVFIEK